MTNDDAPVGYYEHLDFNSPMTGRTADDIVGQLAPNGPTTITDIGCGWGELLLRLLTACPEATGHGIDDDDALIERARRNAESRSLLPRVRFSESVEMATPSDLVLCVGSEHIFGDLDAAIAGLQPLVDVGGTLLLGTLIWERAPSPELAETFAGVPTLEELAATAVEAGWRPLGLRVATPEDWDTFEFGFLADWEHAVMVSPAADEARRSADRHRADYLARRGILGFAFLTLGRPAQ